LGGRGSAWTAAACRRCGRWARVEPCPSSNRYHRAGVEPGPPKSWDGGQIRPKPSVPADGGTVSTPAGIGGRPSTASPVNDDSLSLREGIDRTPHGQCPTLAPETHHGGRALGSGEAIPPRMSADCCSARGLGIRAGWVSKPLGPNRQTGRVHVALSARTTGRSRTRAGAPHQFSTWGREWRCNCGAIVPLLRRPLGRAVAPTELLAGTTCPKGRPSQPSRRPPPSKRSGPHRNPAAC
jgi:hypothetical protein